MVGEIKTNAVRFTNKKCIKLSKPKLNYINKLNFNFVDMVGGSERGGWGGGYKIGSIILAYFMI